jgi:hypothetical protein
VALLSSGLCGLGEAPSLGHQEAGLLCSAYCVAAADVLVSTWLADGAKMRTVAMTLGAVRSEAATVSKPDSNCVPVTDVLMCT